MNLRSIGAHALGAAVILASMAVDASAHASSATYVAAEMTKGRLNSAESKLGDLVALTLKDNVKSNGQVVLKKGTTIKGVVKNIKRIEGKTGAKGQAQSMMEIQWLTPVAQGKAAQQLSIALRSVKQSGPLYPRKQKADADDFGLARSSTAAGKAAAPRAVPAVSGVGSTVKPVRSASSRTSGQSNAALLNMPSVVAVDRQTSSAIDSSLGTSPSGPLFKTGSGELVSPGGSKQSVEFFSHLNNDTVITAQNKNFEISIGAQMQLLVGMNKK